MSRSRTRYQKGKVLSSYTNMPDIKTYLNDAMALDCINVLSCRPRVTIKVTLSNVPSELSCHKETHTPNKKALPLMV